LREVKNSSLVIRGFEITSKLARTCSIFFIPTSEERRDFVGIDLRS